MLALTYPTANCHLLLSRGIGKAPALDKQVRAACTLAHLFHAIFDAFVV
jgi:hypothetical protein